MHLELQQYLRKSRFLKFNHTGLVELTKRQRLHPNAAASIHTAIASLITTSATASQATFTASFGSDCQLRRRIVRLEIQF